MKKRLLCLVLFMLHYCRFCTSSEENRYKKCLENSSLKSVNLYWSKSSISGNQIFQQKVSLNEEILNLSVELMVSTCICREKLLEPIFFISPYYENDHLEDVYVYCIPGEPESFGIYDEYEIFDSLLIQHVLQIPNSLMIPLLDESVIEKDTCLDKDGFPTKKIANQKACMIAIRMETNNEVELYSGPLTLSILKEYSFEKHDPIFKKCYTSLNDTTFQNDDSCVYILPISTFLCCCAKEPQKCSFNYTSEVKNMNGRNLFCASNEIMENRIYTFLHPYAPLFAEEKKVAEISLQEYYKRSVGNSCGIKIYTEFKINDKTQKNESVFKVDYYATNSCEDETVVNITASSYCASTETVLENVQIYKCCKDGHFCNINLTKIDVKDPIENNCHYKPAVLLAFDNQNVCEVYYDLTEHVNVYLYQHFNVEIVYETILKYSKYYCSYVYAKIIKADFKNCSVKIYNENALKSLRPLIRCACTGTKCDKDKWEFLEKTFKCQKFKDQSFGDNFESATTSKSWICYIEIKDFYEGSQINGGHFDVNAERNQTKVKECHDNGIFDDPLFCCVNIVNKDQRYSECTKEKQIDRFKEYKAKSKEPSESGNSNQNYNHGMDSKHIHCYSKDIENSESEHCPSSDGCFSTRTLQTSETSIEPAGCLGYAEDYTIKNLHATSVSLGCRVGENSNRCSIVQSPDGQQRVVCCCNQNDENGLCNTNLNKVPEKIGKSVSSFKSLS